MLAGITLSLHASDLRSTTDAYVARNQQAIISELVGLLSIPNIAADRPNIIRNAEHLRAMLERRGFAAEILKTQGNPLVYGDLEVPGAVRTLLFYIHHDGQPIDRKGWQQPDPFKPILRNGRLEDNAREIAGFLKLTKFDHDWRIYARSASDDKSPIVAFCAAVDALSIQKTKTSASATFSGRL